MKKAALWMQSILPKHYTCKPLKNGWQCQSLKGIDDEEQWDYIMAAIKQKFGKWTIMIPHTLLVDSFNESLENNTKNFTVYPKPKEKSKKSNSVKEEIVHCKKCNGKTFFVDWKITRKKYNSKEIGFNIYLKCAFCGWKLPVPAKYIPEPTATIKFIINPTSL